MSDEEWIAEVRDVVRERVRRRLLDLTLSEVASLDRIEALVRALSVALATVAFEVWAEVLTQMAISVARDCPGCGHARKCKRRAPIEVCVLGLTVSVPKPYLECARCEAPGVSITTLVSGLASGQASSELMLRAGYAGSQHSYGKAKRDLLVHYGETVERAKLRRMALEVEADAQDYAERVRKEALASVEGERRTSGVPLLMLQADGGVVRTGTLAPCVEGDAGFGKKTAKRGLPRRKRDTQFRELMTFDVRVPGEVEASALDVMVPVHAPEGERARRMLALAARRGLGDDTEVIGLGDMGSSLPAAFAEAFFGHPKSRWYDDWHHVCDYIRKAGDVLVGIDVALWRQRTRDACWTRDERERERLVRRARKHRVPNLPAHLQKCPVATLDTYLRNNWDHIRSAELKARGLEYVSSRAESQVRDRTHGRFHVAGAWTSENLEGKAVLRSIIDDGHWPDFRADYLRRAAATHDAKLASRLEQARASRRLTDAQIAKIMGRPSAEQQKAA
jgi:hypothetical protein